MLLMPECFLQILSYFVTLILFNMSGYLACSSIISGHTKFAYIWKFSLGRAPSLFLFRPYSFSFQIYSMGKFYGTKRSSYKEVVNNASFLTSFM